jgi:anti-anti-sigma factor
VTGRLDLSPQAATVTLAGDIDVTVSEKAALLLEQAIAADRPRIVVEVGDVTVLDSTAMRTLLDAHRGAARRGRPLLVRNLRGYPRRMTELAGLHLTLCLDDGAAA